MTDFYDAFTKPERPATVNTAPTRPATPGYANAALHNEVLSVSGATEGTRNHTLNKASYSLGQLVAAGALDETLVHAELTNAALTAGLEPSEVEATIRSGISAGAKTPRQIPARPEKPAQTRSAPAKGTPASPRRTRLTPAGSITPKVVVWAWRDHDGHGRIPAASLTASAGREGTGKSSFGLWLASKISQGTLRGSYLGTPRNVIYLAVEDSWRYTLVPRLMAADADMARIYRLDVVTDKDEAVTLSLPSDFTELERSITELNAGLVVLDPLMSVMGDTIDTHKNREVRQALDPLAQLAERTGTLLHGIMHFNKSSGTDAASLISGSGAFKDVPRALFGFAKDDASRVMTQVKNSLGRDDLPSLEYRIEECQVEVSDGTTSVGRFTFVGKSEREVAEVLSTASGSYEDREERSDAATWLRGWLLDNGGEGTPVDIQKACSSAGQKWDTVRRASVKSKAGVKSEKRGFGGLWVWTLDAA